MFGDFLKVIGASLGWVVEITLDAAEAYLRFLHMAIVPSLIAVGVGAGAFVFSEVSQVAGLNALGLLLIGAVLLFWFAAAQPVVEGVRVLGELAAPVKRICDRMISAILATGVVVLTSIHMPPGVAGLQRIGILLVFLAGAVLLGLQITRKTIGIKLIVLAGLMAASLLLPGTFSSLGTLLPAADVTLMNAVVPKNKEIALTLDSIAGRDSSAPRLFIDGDANWYCRRARESDTGYRCFRYPGRDDATNEHLVPISSDIINDIKARLLAKSHANSQAASNIEAARRKVIEDKNAADDRASEVTLQNEKVERRRVEATARARWQSFEVGIGSAPSSWSENPSWRSDVGGKYVLIQYTDRRRMEAIEIARRLDALGAEVTHLRVVPATNDSSSHLMYAFSNFEAADAIRAAVINVVRLDLLSSDSGVRQIEIVLK